MANRCVKHSKNANFCQEIKSCQCISGYGTVITEVGREERGLTDIGIVVVRLEIPSAKREILKGF